MSLTNLDWTQVLRSSYDDAGQRLRVDAQVTAVIGTVTVDIDAASGDNIAISDGTNTANVNPDGSLDVNIVNDVNIEIDAADGDNIAISDGTDTLVINTDGSINVKQVVNGTLTSTYNEVIGVASGISTTIATFNVTTDTRLKQIDAAGTNIATYTVLVNGTPIDKNYTSFSSPPSCSFTYDEGILLTSGDTIALTVLHTRPFLGNFNGKIIVIES